MKNESITLMQIIIPVASIVFGVVVGFIVEKLIVSKLKKLAKLAKWDGYSIVFTAIKGIPILWCILAGIYIAIINLPLSVGISTSIQKVLLVIALFSATVVLVRGSTGFVNLYTSKAGGAFPSASIFANLTKVIVFALGIMVILQSLGVSITPMLTALGVGGLAIALALQGTLSDLFSGLQVIASKQVKPGDYIKLNSGEEGYVVDITWKNTTIRQLPNNMVIVPNSKLSSAIITNYNHPEKEMSVLVQIGVSYASDLKKVEKITIEVARETMKDVKGGVPEFEPFIRYHTFADFSINFTVILRVKEFVDQYLLKHEFVKRLHERYNKEGIIIPFPIRTVQMEK